jgi:selenocysteine lyase/cysteine desulfurase
MDELRSFYPSIQKHSTKIFCENAGGSQVPRQVIAAMNDYMVDSRAQPGSTNATSKIMTTNMQEVHRVMNIMLNNTDGKLIFGSSFTQLMYNLAHAMESEMDGASEIIIPTFSHESAVSPFERIAQSRNSAVKYWRLSADFRLDYEALIDQVTPNTRLVVLPHVSNVTGNIIDVKALCARIKTKCPAARVVVDGVAALPHCSIDVADMNVDAYGISMYKMTGMRTSVLYIKSDWLMKLENQNHYFFETSLEKKLELGGANFDTAASILGFRDYILDIAHCLGAHENSNHEFDRAIMMFVMERIEEHERLLVNTYDEIFDVPDEQVTQITDKTKPRVPIFSLKYHNYSHHIINTILNELGLVSSYGRYHCDRLINELNLDDQEGVLRMSWLHYNTCEEVRKVVGYLNMFKTAQSEFKYAVEPFELSQTILDSFDYLPADVYYESPRQRGFSLVDVDAFSIVGNMPFYQSQQYNNYNGNKTRDYKNIDARLLSDGAFKGMVQKFKILVGEHTGVFPSYIQVHQMRVHAASVADGSVTPVPEGVHQDGFNFVGIHVINRHNIVGGVTTVYDTDKTVLCQKILDAGQAAYVNDRSVWHHVSNIEKLDAEQSGWRDVFVFTTLN